MTPQHPPSDVRAVLVSHADVSNAHTDAGLPAFREALRDRFNAAHRQACIQWCSLHGEPVISPRFDEPADACVGVWRDGAECNIGVALVVPLSHFAPQHPPSDATA